MDNWFELQCRKSFIIIRIKYWMFFFPQGVYGGGSQRKTSGTLYLFNVTREDDGIYVCVTHNPLLNISKMSRPAKLNVRGDFSCVFLLLVHGIFISCDNFF